MSIVLHELEQISWELMIPVTMGMVLALYLWDGICLRVLFSLESAPLSYFQCLHARGLSYLGSAVNYELGQGILAWRIARTQTSSVMSALSRTGLLAYHDLIVLVGLGGAGASLSNYPNAAKTQAFCCAAMGILILTGIIPLLLSRKQRQKLQQRRWAAWWRDWSWHRSFRLLVCRVIYYGILIGYAGSAFSVARLSINRFTVLSTIPMVLLADALPSMAGLGTRETSLQLLLPTDRPEALLALSLCWSLGIILGRVILGILHLWLESARVSTSTSSKSIKIV